jgi:hypothetical protein
MCHCHALLLSNSRPTAFQIHSYDETPYQSFMQSAAPTRPPSRNSQSSMNVEMGGVQESGVMKASQDQYFGPATRETYEAARWALTTTILPDSSASAAEIYPDVEIRQLSRSYEKPVFMKPITSQSLLPALISILAAIPLMRKYVLEGPPALDNYGQGANWWSGTPISDAHVVVDAAQSDDPLKDSTELLAETQRLVAFVMWSNRIYGSVEPLEALPALQEVSTGNSQVQAKDSVSRFLKAWSKAMKQHEPHSPASLLFHSVVGGPEAMAPIEFCQLEIKLARTPYRQTLYEAVDSIIWDDDIANDKNDYKSLLVVPPILVLQVRNLDANARELGMDIPAEWYLDRYMEKSKEIMISTRKEMAAWTRQKWAIEEKIKSLDFTKLHRSAPRTSSTTMLQAAIDYLQQERELGVELDDDDEELECTTVKDEERSRCIAARLQSLYYNLTLKTAELDNKTVAITQKLNELSGILKTPSNGQAGNAQLEQRYRLCGISTKPTIVYLPGPISDGEDGWWKMEYTPSPHVNSEASSFSPFLAHAGFF